jgi:hypothetical protein
LIEAFNARHPGKQVNYSLAELPASVGPLGEAVNRAAALANTKRLLILCNPLDKELSVGELAERGRVPSLSPRSGA